MLLVAHAQSSLLDDVCLVEEAHMSKHHDGAENERSRVRHSFACTQREKPSASLGLYVSALVPAISGALN